MRRLRTPIAVIAGALAVVGLGLLSSGCAPKPAARLTAWGEPERGSMLVDREACGSCHIIPGHAAGIGVVGPPLAGLGQRSMIAGVLPNTPENLAAWLRDPQHFVPGNGMPDVGLTEQQARDIAAYLQTLG